MSAIGYHHRRRWELMPGDSKRARTFSEMKSVPNEPQRECYDTSFSPTTADLGVHPKEIRNV
jgi:hypothetical protein